MTFFCPVKLFAHLSIKLSKSFVYISKKNFKNSVTMNSIRNKKTGKVFYRLYCVTDELCCVLIITGVNAC